MPTKILKMKLKGQGALAYRISHRAYWYLKNGEWYVSPTPPEGAYFYKSNLYLGRYTTSIFITPKLQKLAGITQGAWLEPAGGSKYRLKKPERAPAPAFITSVRRGAPPSYVTTVPAPILEYFGLKAHQRAYIELEPPFMYFKPTPPKECVAPFCGKRALRATGPHNIIITIPAGIVKLLEIKPRDKLVWRLVTENSVEVRKGEPPP